VFDLRLQRTCAHEIFDQPVSISGLSPNYFSVLPFVTDGSSNMITAREFSATEGLSNFSYKTNGFTNWRLLSDNITIQWNGLTSGTLGSVLGGPGSGIASFLDGSTLITPPPQMIVSFRTIPTRCPLCLNQQNLSKDIDFDLQGRLRILTGNDKVRQLVFKALLTELGSNQLLPDYGSTVSASIGQKFDVYSQLQLYNSVQQAVQFLIGEQANNPNLPLNETILGVQNVGVNQDYGDPRVIRITMDVQVGDFTTTSINFNLVTS
jgi:hypothetical protein